MRRRGRQGGAGSPVIRKAGEREIPKAGVPLLQYRPEWIDSPPPRGRVGFTFGCPRHPNNHRIALWFENPGDHGEPVRARRLYWRQGSSFDSLTVFGLDEEQAINVPGHWRGWLVEGLLFESMRLAGIE